MDWITTVYPGFAFCERSFEINMKNYGLCSYTCSPVFIANFAKTLRSLAKELRIVGIGLGKIGIYVVWWRDWYPSPIDGDY